MRFPWSKTPETRAGYTDAVLEAIFANATGTNNSASVGATAAVEASASFTARAFSLANVITDRPMVKDVLTPSLMGLVGRSLIRDGQLILYLSVDDTIELLPVRKADIAGGPSPSSWVYDLEIPSPSGTIKRVASWDSVVHFQYAQEPGRPWASLSPMASANLAGKLSAETARSLGFESSGPVASLLPIPTDGQDETITKMRADIRAAKGAAMLVEGGDWGDAQSGQNLASWMPRRLAPNPSQALVQLHELCFRETAAACGLNPSMLFGMSDGTMAREAARSAGVAAEALLKPVAQELSVKLDTPVSFDLAPLRSSDAMGRARAFSSMVQGGMEIERAAALAGLLLGDD